MTIAPRDIPDAAEALLAALHPTLAVLADIRRGRGAPASVTGFAAVPAADGWSFRFDAPEIAGARDETGHETMRRAQAEADAAAGAAPRLEAILKAADAALLGLAVLVQSDNRPYSDRVALAPLAPDGAVAETKTVYAGRLFGREMQRLAKLARGIPEALRAPPRDPQPWSVTMECRDIHGGAFRTTAVLSADTPETAASLAALRHRAAFIARCLGAQASAPAYGVALVDIHRHWEIDVATRLRLQTHVDRVVGVRSLAAA